jgi:elongation factor G
MTVCIEAVNKGEEEKMAQALHQLREEDPTLQVEVSQELKQTLIHCQGDMHLAVAKWKIEQLHKVRCGLDGHVFHTGKRSGKQRNQVIAIKSNQVAPGSSVKCTCALNPMVDGMPEPEGLNIRGREVFQLNWGGKLVFYNCIVGGAIDTGSCLPYLR